ncbi:MAG: DUF4249 domain-containing protein [Sphingobacteriaceae bacterium]|nr:MAG: DUF4249 domain-containing protein [Sphingobacteriaceae bacterium]
MKNIKFLLSLTFVIIALYGCQKPIDIKTTATNYNILVVEGLINVADSTKISLSRTVTIGNKTTANPEQGATVTIETAQATIATLKEIVKGTYATPVLNLDKTQKYRVRVKLSNGKVYLSDLVEVKVTQPIDSVGYTIKSDGVQVYANTHDDSNNSRYYLYNFTETYKFNTFARSFLIYDKGLRERTTAEDIHTCFATTSSNNIVLYSTANLTQDVAYQAPITFHQSTSEKISIRYTILLTQTAVTKEAYRFWENLKTSTESLGSIFDAQPSQLVGNIHNIANANEPVIGYISAGTTQTKRIFIDRKELPSDFKVQYPFGCSLGIASPIFFEGILNPYVPLYHYVDPNVGASNDAWYTDKKCGDCRFRGTLKQPTFWK